MGFVGARGVFVLRVRDVDLYMLLFVVYFTLLDFVCNTSIAQLCNICSLQGWLWGDIACT